MWVWFTSSRRPYVNAGVCVYTHTLLWQDSYTAVCGAFPFFSTCNRFWGAQLLWCNALRNIRQTNTCAWRGKPQSHMDITGLSDRMWKRPIAFWKCLFVMVCATLSLENILNFFKQQPSLHQLLIYHIFHLLVPLPFPVNEAQMCVPKKNTTSLIC